MPDQATLWAEADALMRLPPDKEYQTRPVDWMVETLGIPRETLVWSSLPEYATHTWDGTVDPLASICEGLAAGLDVGVESGTGTGKTYLAAAVCLWFVACWEDAVVITTAPKEQQLTAQLWKEIGRHWPRFVERYPMATTVQLRVRFREGAGEQERWGILGYACGVGAAEESATKAQGFHSAHMLIVTEETPGIDPAVMAAFANTSTGNHNLRLALGNPDFQLDSLHRFCTEPSVRAVRISALDHPNVVCDRDVIPGAAGRKSVTKQAETWGVGSAMYNSRVRGISPAESSNALIRLEWCERAADQWKNPAYRTGVLALGVDVAQSENGDKSAISRWDGACLLEVESHPCPNATELGRDVAREVRQKGIDARHVGVDPIGVGAATINELRVSVGAVHALNGGEKPLDRAQKGSDGRTNEWMPDANEHRNLRSQMWWQLREDLRLGRVALPNNPELFRQLTMPTFKITNGEVQIEQKIEVRKRLGRSPDDADAVVYGNWVRDRNVLTNVKEPLMKRQDRGRRWDYKNKRSLELSTEQAFQQIMGEGNERDGQFMPELPRWTS